MAQQMTGDYAAAAANVAAAIDVFRDLGSQRCLAQALNDRGELSLRTSAIRQAREHHHEALAIARGFGVPLQEARALDGIGRTFLGQDDAEAAAHLRRALAIYQHIGVPDAQRVRDVLHEHGLQ
jgi:tetratricopeptide (TPR) repeat protein